MADYEQSGNRYTAIFVLESNRGGDRPLYKRAPFDLVRFNVDTNPSAPQEIVPLGAVAGNASGTTSDVEKIYEKVWVVDTMPFRPGAGGKQDFGNGHID